MLHDTPSSWFSHFHRRLLRQLVLASLLLCAACVWPQSRSPKLAKAPPASEPFAVGADLSFLGEAEARGVVFRDGGEAKPGLKLFRDHGYDWVRLRLFHSPAAHRSALPNDLAYTIAQARAAKALGFKLLLNFHYSDTWADPAHQITPEAWKELGPEDLAAAVRTYTRDCIRAFRTAGAMPDMVQPGNEVTAGMLWPIGKLPDNWDQFATLTRAGIAGVHEGAEGAPTPKILVQIERSGNWEATKWFFDRLFASGVEPDVLGQSYYPWWHGSLDDLRTTLHHMARTYRKPVMVVETAYCWRPTEYVEGREPVGPPPFPESIAGQRDFLAAVSDVVRGVPDDLGAGVFWWEPAVGVGRGRSRLRSRGMFDDAGNVLPVIDAARPPSAIGAR
jgi:arabinogalactan endo-1,4-beta-galactosidase